MLSLAFSNLNRRKMRIFLLSLTVIIATSFLVAIMILGNSLLAAVKGVENNELINEIFTAEFITIIRNVLIAFNILALFIGGFVIKNTFTVILTQRSKELALMRTIGASKAQIFKLVIWEALIIGLVGALAGILIGVGLAQALLSLSQAMDWEIPNVGLRFNAGVFIWPIVLGVLVTMVSAIIPAFKASWQSPLKALTGVEQLIKNVYIARLITGSIIAALGFLIAFIIIVTGLKPFEPGMENTTISLILSLRIFALFVGLIFLFVGSTILAPIIAKFFAGLSMRALKNSRFISWRLAAGNIWRQPLRSATTANVLMIGITLITTVTVILGSFKATAVYLIEEFFPIDWTIQYQPERFDGNFDFTPEPSIEKTVYTQVKGIDGKIEVIGLRYNYAKTVFNDDSGTYVLPERLEDPEDPRDSPAGLQEFIQDHYNLAGLDPVDRVGDYFYLDLDDRELANLRDGQLMVRDSLLHDKGLKLGSEITLSYLRAKDQPVLDIESSEEQVLYESKFIIGGTFANPFDGMDLILNNDAYEQFTQETNYTYLIVNNLGGKADDKVRGSLEEIIVARDDLRIYGQDDILDEVNQVFAWILNIFRGLLSLSFIVAIAGIFNTLILSVFERTREIGLLRAVGASTKLVRRMITIEAVQIATLGVVMGTLLGIFFAWGIIETTIQDLLRASMSEESEVALTFVFNIPFFELLLYYVIALILALIAAFWPALKATRLKIIESLTAK